MPGDPRAKFRIVGDNSDYRRALKQSQRETNSFAKSVGGALRVGAVAGAAAITGAAFAIRQLTAEAARNADSLAKQADVLGITTEKLAAYRHAAELTGVGQDGLEKGIRKLQKSVVDATNGLTTYTRAFDALQLDPEQLKRMAPNEQFEAVGKALAGVETQAERVAIAYDLFGGRNTALLNTLVLTGEQLNDIEADTKAWGLALSRVDARQIEKANDAVTRAKTATQGIATNIALAIAPIREGLANAFADSAAEANGFKSQINTALEALVVGANFASNAINGIRLAFLGAKLAALETARAAADALGKLDYSFVGIYGGFRKNENAGASKELIESLDATGAKIDEIVGKFRSGDQALEDFRAALAESQAEAAASLATAAGGVDTGDAGTATDFFSDAQREALAARLAALQSTLQSETEAIIAARDQRLALADESFEAELLTFEERENLKAQVYQQAADKLLDIDRRRMAQQQAIEQHHQAMIVAMRAEAVGSAIGLLQTLGQRSKTLARIAFVAEKAVAVSRIIVNTNIAAVRALAELGPIAGPPAAASIKAWGYATAAATAATAIAGLGGIGGGGPAIGGGTATGISSSTDGLTGAQADETFGSGPRNVTHVHVSGSLLAGQDTLDSLKSWIRDLTDADEVIISGNSRQAQELRGTT